MRGFFSLLCLIFISTACSVADKSAAVNPTPSDPAVTLATANTLAQAPANALPPANTNALPDDSVSKLLNGPTKPPIKSVPKSVTKDPNESTLSTNKNTPIEIVATDLVTTISQLTEFSPFSTTIQYSDEDDEYGFALIAALKNSGYGIQKVPDGQGVNFLEYSKVEKLNPGGSTLFKFSVSIRNITITRDFRLFDNFYIPVSGFEIIGSNPQNVSLLENTYPQPSSLSNLPNSITFLSSLGDVQAVTSQSLGDEIVGPGEIERSTLLGVRTYRPKKHLVIRFFPGSLELGEKNKQAIRLLRNTFSRSKNRLIITSCDERSLDWDGTFEKSRKRSERINQELLTLEVPVETIQIEPCTNPKYPSNLVENSSVITLEVTDNFL